MTKSNIHKILTYCIAMVWMINGFFCKMLNLVPRHQQIVGKILGNDYSRELTFLIGVAELLMAIWILSRFKTRLNTLAQIIVVTTMNIVEFLLVPDLLLWKKYNAVFAFFFVLVVFCNEIFLNKKNSTFS